MKKFAALMMILSLSVLTVGCGGDKTPAAKTDVKTPNAKTNKTDKMEAKTDAPEPKTDAPEKTE